MRQNESESDTKTRQRQKAEGSAYMHRNVWDGDDSCESHRIRSVHLEYVRDARAKDGELALSSERKGQPKVQRI